MGMNENDEEDDEESPKSRTGRFSIQHRGGTRVEVSEPIHIGGETPWMCAVKLVGHKGPELDSDQTQTLLVRTGRGATPEEAQRNAMGQLTLVYGSPVDPPPSPMISQMKTDPPGPPSTPPPPPPDPDKRPSLLQRLFGRRK
jgi:hypothetical protein